MGKDAENRGTTREDPLHVQSVEKAFRVLTAFDAAHPTLSLTQVAAIVGIDKSAAQRFTHTLERLGFLRKDPATKHFELTVRTLDLGYHYLRTSGLIDRAMPYLQHLSKTTEETVNLTVRDGAEIVFVSRFMSRHVLNTDVIVGTRMPVSCTAPGLAMLAALPPGEARGLLARSDRRAFTSTTLTDVEELMAAVERGAARGYATAFEQYYPDDLSFAAAILDGAEAPLGAINISVSRARFTPDEAEARFAPLVVAAAAALSRPSLARSR